MDLYRVIADLTEERDRLDRIIRSLETMTDDAPKPGRAPRRSTMDDSARRAVSERMKRYWAKRRAESGEK